MKLSDKRKKVEEVKKAISSGGSRNNNADVIVPVCQKILAKRIVPSSNSKGEDAKKWILEATIIQRVLGYGSEQEPFQYRVNGSIPEEGTFTVRRSVPLVSTTTDKGAKSAGSLGTSFTIDARVPLELEEKFSLFPFRIVCASLSLEMASPSNTNGTILRPSLWHFDESGGGTPTEVFQLKKGGDILDRLPLWDSVDPNPLRSCPREKKTDGTLYYPKTELTWFIAQSAFKRLLPVLVPFYLILLFSIVNWGVHLYENVDQSKYLMTSVGITVMAIIALPSVLSSLELQKSRFNPNDCVYLLWIMGLGLSCIPGRHWALGGIAFLASAGTIPMIFFVMFFRKQRELCNLVRQLQYAKVPVSNEKPRGGEIDLELWTPHEPSAEDTT